jgi:GntR family transcriptional regulator
LYLFRQRLVDEVPIALNVSYIRLPADVCVSEGELAANTSLWSLLEFKGIRLIETDKVISAILADEEYAPLLNVPVGVALLMVEGLVYTINHVPVEFSQVISLGDRYKYSVHLNR